jgi:hypothetical protein
MTNPAYSAAWAQFPYLSGCMMIAEQFLFSACFEFHRSHPQSPFRGGMHTRYLFPSFAEAYNHEAATGDGSFYGLRLSRHNPFARPAL